MSENNLSKSINILEKRDKTRLRNLLKDYRDEIITTIKNKSSHREITDIIEKVDTAINIILFGINKDRW